MLYTSGHSSAMLGYCTAPYTRPLPPACSQAHSERVRGGVVHTQPLTAFVRQTCSQDHALTVSLSCQQEYQPSRNETGIIAPHCLAGGAHSTFLCPLKELATTLDVYRFQRVVFKMLVYRGNRFVSKRGQNPSSGYVGLELLRTLACNGPTTLSALRPGLTEN